MPRFVILRHEVPPGYERPSHWDFMLEWGDALRTWALPDEPRPGSVQVAERLSDHRLEYLDYEGPVSANRGHVMCWDQGTYELVCETPAALEAQLDGHRYAGTVVVEQLDARHQRLTFV